MPKYIDADAFVKEMREWYCEQCQNRKGMKRGKLQFVYEIGDAPCRACDVDDVISDIEDFPAADVVPAPVRCSDCRFYDKRDGGAPGGTGWCSRPGAGCGVPEEFFCAGAERKEDKSDDRD